jgi:hypothetical protein
LPPPTNHPLPPCSVSTADCIQEVAQPPQPPLTPHLTTTPPLPPPPPKTNSVSTDDYIQEVTNLCTEMLKDYMLPRGQYAAGQTKVLSTGAVQT